MLLPSTYFYQRRFVVLNSLTTSFLGFILSSSHSHLPINADSRLLFFLIPVQKCSDSVQVTVVHILFPRFLERSEILITRSQMRPGQGVSLRAVPIRAVLDPLPSKADPKVAPLARIMLSNIARVHRLLDPGRPAGSPPSVITGCNGEARCKKASMSAAYRWLMIY